MNEPTGEVWLVRHGETEWSRARRHTSVTDVRLTDDGIATARALRARLSGEAFDRVLASPMQRARHTAELAGFPHPEVDEDVVEWDYGDYEGITAAEIRETVPGWTVWTHGVPGGETAEQVTERLDRVVSRLREGDERCLVFGHGHGLRALAARWLGLPVSEGRLLRLDTTTVCRLGYERETPVILGWNCPAGPAEG